MFGIAPDVYIIARDIRDTQQLRKFIDDGLFILLTPGTHNAGRISQQGRHGKRQHRQQQ
jgi:hypothetical protein